MALLAVLNICAESTGLSSLHPPRVSLPTCFVDTTRGGQTETPLWSRDSWFAPMEQYSGASRLESRSRPHTNALYCFETGRLVSFVQSAPMMHAICENGPLPTIHLPLRFAFATSSHDRGNRQPSERDSPSDFLISRHCIRTAKGCP